MVSRSPEELAESATGNIKTKHLTKDSGILFTYLYDGPLIEHLNEEEQPEYIFSNENKGYRITEPHRKERTPHHTGSEGKRYLLVTDQRVLYVAGCKSGDEIIEHTYDEIKDADAVGTVGFRNIQFETTDGVTYKFAPTDSEAVGEAVDYISEFASKPESERESPSSKSSKSEETSSHIEVGLSVYSESELTGQLSRVSQELAKRQNETRHTQMLGEGYTELVYEFNSKKELSLENDGISIGDIIVLYKDILNARLLKDRDLIASSDSSFVFHSCDYIALTVAKDGIQPDQPPSDYEGEVFHLYLIGKPKKLSYYGTVYHNNDDQFLIGNSLSVSRTQLEKVFSEIQEKISESLPETYILQDYIERPSHLKIEGWQESGGTNINAGVGGELSNTGSSRGIQIGPYSRSKSKSKGTITAELDGNIADNSFSSEIDFIQVSEKGLYIDSDPVLDIDYEAIDRVLKRDKGFTIEADGTAYTIVGPRQLTSMLLGKDGSFSALDSPNLEEAIVFIQEQVSQSRDNKEPVEESDNKSADKLRELKELHDEGILTDDEFESKKEDLLDDF
jgi:hypothetical protein